MYAVVITMAMATCSRGQDAPTDPPSVSIQCLLTLRGHERWIACVAFSPDGRSIVSGDGTDTLKVWDALSGKEKRTLRGSGKGVMAVAISRDSKRLVSGHWDGTLKLWDLRSGTALRTVHAHTENVTSIAFSPDGTRIVSGSADDTLKIWDTATGNELLSIESGNEYDITAVAFSPDGKRVASGDGENLVRVWDAHSGEELLTLEGHEAAITSVAFSPDGRSLVSGSGDKTLRIWDATSGKELRTLHGHTRDVTSVALSSDSRRIASASEDHTLKVWAAGSGKELASLRGHAGSVAAVAFSPDGRQIVSAGKDALKLWALDAGVDPYQTLIVPFLKRHCYACHGPDKQESRLRLDQVTGVQIGNRNLWTLVHERVAAGEMPPKGRPQPPDAKRQQVLTWIAEQQRALGPGGTRRLNRRELAAALRDVTGLDVDFAHALPGDGKVAGFDTGAEGLQEASDAVDQWLTVTRRAVDGIRFLEPAKGPVFAIDLRAVRDLRKAFDAWKRDGVLLREFGGVKPGRTGEGMLLEPRAVGERDGFNVTVPIAAGRRGMLRLTLTVTAMRPFAGLPDPHLWVTIGGRDIDFRAITGTPERPQQLVYEVHLGDLVVQPKGVSIRLSNKVEIPYAVEGFANEEQKNLKTPIPGGTGLYRPLFDRRTLPPDKQPAPFVAVQQITIEPDVVHRWPPGSWRADSAESKDQPECARRLLALWMERAWRRPVRDAERAPFVQLYEKLRGQKHSFDDALRAVFQSVLLSAPFRYQASPADPNPIIAQHAIAARLSFMLTGAPPDAELRRLAAAGRLREPNVLDAQVDRLLADPRSQGFVRPFVTQWLELEQPITIAQAHINRQDFRFARYLKQSMCDETIAYVSQMLAENRPARELIVSDWTMMNDALAIHYRYQPIASGTLRKVQLRADDPRGGGLLGHAGIQSMLCWMGENWVIYRGAWALRHILDQPPPPPPLEVPELNPSDAKNRGKPFRELLRQHQQDARCAVCHKTIDPLGFAFQNFDISGRWREREYHHYERKELDGRIAWYGVGDTRPVDSAGHLPRGETFSSFAEFKNVVVQDYQTDLVRGLLKNLMVYGTGRTPGIDDMHEIASIMRQQRSKNYPLRDLLKTVVRSTAFLGTGEPPVSSQPTLNGRPK